MSASSTLFISAIARATGRSLTELTVMLTAADAAALHKLISDWLPLKSVA